MKKCTHCQREEEDYPGYGPTGLAWWFISGYHGIWGYLCPTCFKMIEHWDGKPKDPKGYKTVMVAQQLRNANPHT